MGNLNELDYIRMQISSVNVKPINPIMAIFADISYCDFIVYAIFSYLLMLSFFTNSYLFWSLLVQLFYGCLL